MTMWARIFRRLGGKGPDDPCVVGTPSRLAETLADGLARGLLRLGFLRRDPELPQLAQGWFVNMRWQWRFWRGAYRDAAIALGLRPPTWWQTVGGRW